MNDTAIPNRTMPAEATMRQAVAARDESFDGAFVYGVVTTGVYCRPSCRSRPAKPENVRFFANPAAAQSAGLRPCKRCEPLALHDRTTELMQALARYIDKNAGESLSLAALAKQAHLSPAHLQRKFKAVLGVSPKAYQDAARLKRLKSGLKSGQRVLESITDAGFQSTSRVYGATTRNLGMTPSAYRAGGADETIAYACRDTALGSLLMAATDRGVCFAQFGKNEIALTTQLKNEFPRATVVPSGMADSPELDAWIRAFEAHIAGTAPRPDLPLDLRGTAFQIRVWRFLLQVSEGDVISYTELAAGIGAPKAVRAAASACAANRIAVLVPCHRVLRGDGGIGGYRWGLERKRALLDRERAERTQ
jgi:AraC family transcriptional regulator, regulatory protein of adaptative response / methylated-DNA-[protein]-cysteine methyltransferase